MEANGEARSTEYLKQLRARMGMTQEEFAHTLGVTVSTMNRWENGHAKPSKLAWKAIRAMDEQAPEGNGTGSNSSQGENGKSTSFPTAMPSERTSSAVREVRLRLGMTQEKFAHALSVTFSTVSRWENGHMKPSTLAWNMIAKLVAQRAATEKLPF